MAYGIGPLKRPFDGGEALLHGLGRSVCKCVRTQVGGPYEPRPAVTLEQDLRGAIVVAVWAVDDRPREASVLLVAAEDLFAKDRTGGERHDPCVAVTRAVGHEPCRESFV